MSALMPEVDIANRPIAHRFFRDALENGCLAHAYVLKGQAYGEMYRLALCIAQVLNCKNPPGKGEACGQCTDCKWILSNAHPAVLTVSRMTYQTDEPAKGQLPRHLSQEEMEKLAKSAKWPTIIKTDQIGLLIYELGIKTDHTRVVIFTDSEELPAAIPSDAPAPYEWRGLEATEERSFHIRPLERKLFNATSANRFLKTLEEPPPGTLFFFIAETEEQLMETIVSRCQVIPYLSAAPRLYGSVSDNYRPFFERLVNGFQRGMPDIYHAASEFEQVLIGEQGLSWPQALDQFQLYLRERFLSGTPDAFRFTHYRAVQQPIEEALKMLAAHTNESQVLVQLFLNLRIPLQSV